MSTAEFFVPDGQPVEQALRRTTHLAIGAHQDDLEIMAASPILACFQREDRWFTAVVVTDGRGSPRNGIYAQYNDEQMRLVRFKEQRKAAIVGEYAAQIMLDYPSKVVKDGHNQYPLQDLTAILRATHPREVYTHNLADKHDTHIAVALKTIAAIRNLPATERPQKLYGCEVWRDLDWMLDSDKVGFDLSQQENLQAALLGVFDSQISGGKRYDLASLARRRANATYYESHGVDKSIGLSFAMDLTPLIFTDEKEPLSFVEEFIQRFKQDVSDRVRRMS
ncbi:MAG TPA: PIG-L family deacetylase [Anaerolineales bacterium]|nr:PIG-L family deacetylase [Anaerolineales bacterium]